MCPLPPGRAGGLLSEPQAVTETWVDQVIRKHSIHHLNIDTTGIGIWIHLLFLKLIDWFICTNKYNSNLFVC